MCCLCRVPAADAKSSQVRTRLTFRVYIWKLNSVRCRKRWMRLSCYPISPLKSEQGSTGTVSPSDLISDPSSFLTRLTDWAYLEDWCRRLTGSFSDVYIFTVPLYLPKLESDGKWRVVSPAVQRLHVFLPHSSKLIFQQTHEVIGSPPNVAVPT